MVATRIILALALAQTSALIAPPTRRSTKLAATQTDCGCEVMTGDVPKKAQTLRHRAVVADLPLVTTDGTRTTLKTSIPERVAVAAFLRSFG